MTKNNKNNGCVADKLNYREKFLVKIVSIIELILGVDYLNSYWRTGVYYNDLKGHDIIKMEYPSNLKDEWLDLYRQRSREYEEYNYITHCAWLVMRDDDIINPNSVISVDNSNKNLEIDIDNGPKENIQKERKKEILLELDRKGFLEPVLEENN